MATRSRFRPGNRTYGVVFLALVLLFVTFTYTTFSKTFVDYDEITLKASKTGLQLPVRADVKIRGVLVGEVLETRTTGDGVDITIGLYPEQRDAVPADVSAQILPKTLFGEKYVALTAPSNTTAGVIPVGAVITQSRVGIELEKVLNDLLPLLRTVQPTELNFALTSVANALDGRGDAVGENLETLDSYLTRLNPEVPELVQSLDRLGQVASVYSEVVPDLSRTLRSTLVTGRTFTDREEQITALFDNVSGLSTTTEAFLERNGDNLVTLADQGAQIVPLLAKYAPQSRCFFEAASAIIPRIEGAFRNKTLHIIVETVPQQPRGYTTADLPVNGDKRGPFPYCNLLDKARNGFYSQRNLPPRFLVPDLNDGIEGNVAKRAAVGDAVRATAAEQELINAAAAPVLGVPMDEVPSLATLLLGPLARGMEVSVR